MKEYEFSIIKYKIVTVLGARNLSEIRFYHEYSTETFTTEDEALKDFWDKMPALELE